MSKKAIKLLHAWENWKAGDIIEEDEGIALTMIEWGRAIEWNGINKKLIKNRPQNKMVKHLINK